AVGGGACALAGGPGCGRRTECGEPAAPDRVAGAAPASGGGGILGAPRGLPVPPAARGSSRTGGRGRCSPPAGGGSRRARLVLPPSPPSAARCPARPGADVPSALRAAAAPPAAVSASAAGRPGPTAGTVGGG